MNMNHHIIDIGKMRGLSFENGKLTMEYYNLTAELQQLYVWLFDSDLNQINVQRIIEISNDVSLSNINQTLKI